MATPEVRIEFHLRDHGWADCKIHVGKKSVSIEGISHLTDALGDMLRAGLMAATGASSHSFSFEGEPRQWHWIFEQSLHHFEFRVVVDDNAPSKTLIECICERDTFARALAMAARHVFDQHGLDGYNIKWNWNGQFSFPLRALIALETALTIQPLPAPARSDGYTVIVAAPKSRRSKPQQ